MRNVTMDANGNLRCWSCGCANFAHKRTISNKASFAFGVTAFGILAPFLSPLHGKKLKCLGCGKYNDVGNAEPMQGVPAANASPTAGPPVPDAAASLVVPTAFRPGRIPPITARSGNIVIRFDGSVIEVSQPASRRSIAIEQLESATLTRTVFGKSKLEFRVKDNGAPILITLSSGDHQFDRLVEKVYLQGITE